MTTWAGPSRLEGALLGFSDYTSEYRMRASASSARSRAVEEVFHLWQPEP